jgi:hypothetical protein
MNITSIAQVRAAFLQALAEIERLGLLAESFSETVRVRDVCYTLKAEHEKKEAPIPVLPRLPEVLDTIHRRILGKMTAQPQSLRAVARQLGLSYRSGHLRQAFADLKNWELIRCAPEGYFA